MDNKNKKIVLPKELQIRMLNFFMKTSIPRKIREDAKKSTTEAIPNESFKRNTSKEGLF